MRPTTPCTILATTLLLAGGCGGAEAPRRSADAPQRELELGHNGVYLGVSCPEPNIVTCDRVGVAVWLAKPAETLTAEVEGRRVELHSPGKLVPGEGTGWEGYLQPAGLREPGGALELTREPGQPRDYWSGVKPLEASVRLRATYADGTTATKRLEALVHPGWG